MRKFLLQADQHGELARPVQAGLGLLSLCLAGACFFAVHGEVPKSSWLAQGALVLLLLGAIPGYISPLSLVVKLWQGSRVEVVDDEHS